MPAWKLIEYLLLRIQHVEGIMVVNSATDFLQTF